ncbi:monovalent cation/H+ antiporter subunit D, partial [Pseudoalteromonas sp. S1612]
FFWPVYLVTSFAILIALSRAGTSLFWECKDKRSESAEYKNARSLQVIVIIGLLACSPLMVIFGGPISEYMMAAATQLHDINGGINAVLKGGM